MCKCNPISTIVKWKIINKNAEVPKKSNKDDACYDVKSVINATIQPGKTIKVNTGLCSEFSKEWELQVRSRSGLASKGIQIANSPGCVDSSYRGEICVLLYNSTSEPFIVNIGDRIAQFKFSRVYEMEFKVVEELSNTDRGQGGFGSTGVK